MAVSGPGGGGVVCGISPGGSSMGSRRGRPDVTSGSARPPAPARGVHFRFPPHSAPAAAEPGKGRGEAAALPPRSAPGGSSGRRRRRRLSCAVPGGDSASDAAAEPMRMEGREAARGGQGSAFKAFPLPAAAGPRDPRCRPEAKFLPKTSRFACPAGNASCALSYSPEMPCPEGFQAAGEQPGGFGSSANGQWRGLGPPSLGCSLQKPRLSRGSYLDARKTPRSVQPPTEPCWGPRGAQGWGLRAGAWRTHSLAGKTVLKSGGEGEASSWGLGTRGGPQGSALAQFCSMPSAPSWGRAWSLPQAAAEGSKLP
ncbi:uncharacterized protein, partial [Melanerpes formicivorus]|uniref:uncharacterized protein n=1 Tax=Melanerpes formicivorus TaxID=211600 RepID=UPI00358E2720